MTFSWVLKNKLHFQIEWGGPITSETFVVSSRYVHVYTALALCTHNTNVSLESIAQMLLSISFVWSQVLQISHSEESHVDFKWTRSLYVKNQYSCSLWGRNMVKQSCIFSSPSSRRNSDNRAKSDFSECVLTSSCANFWPQMLFLSKSHFPLFCIWSDAWNEDKEVQLTLKSLTLCPFKKADAAAAKTQYHKVGYWCQFTIPFLFYSNCSWTILPSVA